MGIFKDIAEKVQQLAQQPIVQTYDSVFSLSTNPYERLEYDRGGLNKVSKNGYVPNEYTGRSKMTYGGMERKKAAMGMSKMDEDMMGSMRSQMMMGGKREGMMYGGRAMKGHGGKMKGGSDIYAMESACNKMAGYNKSLPKGR